MNDPPFTCTCMHFHADTYTYTSSIPILPAWITSFIYIHSDTLLYLSFPISFSGGHQVLYFSFSLLVLVRAAFILVKNR